MMLTGIGQTVRELVAELDRLDRERDRLARLIEERREAELQRQCQCVNDRLTSQKRERAA